MKLLTVTLAESMLIILFVGIGNSDRWPEILKQKLQNLKSHHVTFFLNFYQNINTFEGHLMIKTITEEVPTMTLYLENSKLSCHRGSFTSIFNNFRHVTINIIVQNECNISSLQHFVDRFVYLQPLNITYPKFLAVIFNDNKKLIEFQVPLRYAWLNNLLDFSILEVNSKDQRAILHYFNPFFNHFTKTDFTSDVEIFPDKLRNVNRYPFTLFIYGESYIKIDKNNGQIRLNDDYFFPLVEIALDMINFHILYARYNAQYFALPNLLNSTVEYIRQNKVNASGLPLSLSLRASDAVAMFTEYEFAQNVALVPTLPLSKISIHCEIMQNFFVLVIIVVSYIFILRLLKISDWSILYLLGILFGKTVPGNTSKMANNVIFMSFFVISRIYISDFYSNVMDIQIIYGERPFNTFQDIDESQLTPYISSKIFNTVFADNDDQHVKNIGDRTQQIENIWSCVDLLNSSKDIMCILVNWNAQAVMKKYRNSDALLKVKMAKPAFSTEMVIYVFEQSSPYVDRFQEVFRSVYEHGIWHKWNGRQRMQSEFTISRETSKNLLLTELIVISIFGYAVAFIMFGIEIIRYHINNQGGFFPNILKRI